MVEKIKPVIILRDLEFMVKLYNHDIRRLVIKFIELEVRLGLDNGLELENGFEVRLELGFTLTTFFIDPYSNYSP